MNKLLSTLVMVVLAVVATGCSIDVPDRIDGQHDIVHTIPEVTVNHTVTIALPADLLVAIEDQCAEVVDPEACRNELIIDFIDTISRLYQEYNNGQANP